jgi:hypothetical protein
MGRVKTFMSTIRESLPTVVLTALLSCTITLMGAWYTLASGIEEDMLQITIKVEKNTQSIELMVEHLQKDLALTREDIAEVRRLVTQHLLNRGN